MDSSKPKKKGVKLRVKDDVKGTDTESKNASALRRRSTPHPNLLKKKSVDLSISNDETYSDDERSDRDSSKPKKKGVKLRVQDDVKGPDTESKNALALRRRSTPHPNLLKKKSVDLSVSNDETRFSDDERSDGVRFGNVTNIDDVTSNNDDGDEGLGDAYNGEIDDGFDQARRLQVRRPTPHPFRNKSAQARTNSLENARREDLLKQHKKAERTRSEPVRVTKEVVTKL